MNAPLSSGESIIAGRFCPRACSAVGTCLRNCKETGSAASGRPPVGKYFETSIRDHAKRGSRAAGYKRHGSLVVKLMRRCILPPPCISSLPRVLSLTLSHPSTLLSRVVFFSTATRFFSRDPLSRQRNQIYRLFFHGETRVFLFDWQIDLIPSVEFPLINVTHWLLVRCATGRNRQRYTPTCIVHACANERRD